MNTQLRMKAANDFEKGFYKLSNNSVYGKTMENVRKHSDIQLVNTDKKRSILASEPNYHSTKYISKDLLIMETKKREVYMNKPIYLRQVILDISKILMDGFLYDYLKREYGKNIKLCNMDTDSFVICIKTDDFDKDIRKDINKWFDTSNYDKNIDRPLQKAVNKKVIGKFKDELGGRIMSKFCAPRHKKPKSQGHKEINVKHTITFKNYVQALFNDKKILRTQYTFKVIIIKYTHKRLIK